MNSMTPVHSSTANHSSSKLFHQCLFQLFPFAFKDPPELWLAGTHFLPHAAYTSLFWKSSSNWSKLHASVDGFDLVSYWTFSYRICRSVTAISSDDYLVLPRCGVTSSWGLMTVKANYFHIIHCQTANSSLKAIASPPTASLTLSWKLYLTFLGTLSLKQFSTLEFWSEPPTGPTKAACPRSFVDISRKVCFYWEEVPFLPSCQENTRLMCYKCSDTRLSSPHRHPWCNGNSWESSLQVCWVILPNTVPSALLLPNISLHVSWLFKWAFWTLTLCKAPRLQTTILALKEPTSRRREKTYAYITTRQISWWCAVLGILQTATTYSED